MYEREAEVFGGRGGLTGAGAVVDRGSFRFGREIGEDLVDAVIGEAAAHLVKEVMARFEGVEE